MDKNPSRRHILPKQIISDWDAVLEKLPRFSEAETGLLRTAIKYSLPPVSRTDILFAIKFYLEDINPETKIQTENLVKLLPIRQDKCEKVATSHPLYTAMQLISTPDEISTSFQKSCRRMLSRYFSIQTSDSHPVTLYQDIIKVRDVLIMVRYKGIEGPRTGEKDDQYLMGLVNQHLTTEKYIPKDLKNKIPTFHKLFRGINKITLDDKTSRLPGHKTGDRPPQRRRKNKRNQDELLDNAIQDSLKKRADRQQQAQILPDETQDRQGEKRAESEFDDLISRGQYHITQVADSTSPDYSAEPDEHVETLQRKKPSTMTAADDRVVVQYAQRMSQIDTLSSMTDIHRPTSEQIMEGLIRCRNNPVQWSLATLLLCTGMPLARLQKLKADTEQVSTADKPNDTPLLIENGTVLTYQLLDGPSGSVNNDNHRWVTLALPDALIQALQQAVLAHGQSPFIRATQPLKRRLSQEIDNTPGLPLTPARLTASSWMLIRPAALDNIAAKALSGRYGIALSAPAAYRALAPGELNEIFQKVVGYLLASLRSYPAPHWLKSPPIAWSITPNPNPATWHTGSARAVPVNAYRSWFGWMQHGMGQALRRFISPAPHQRSPRDLLDAVAISAAHAYLVMLLATGCRPHGHRVRCERLDGHIWLADKNSRRALESRWIAVSRELQASLDAHKVLVEAAAKWLDREGYTINDHRLIGQWSLSAEINWTHSRKMTVTPITHRGFIQLLSNLQPVGSHASLVPDEAESNVTRHSVATYCRRRLSETQISAMLGHVHGFRQQGPGSSATAPARSHWQAVISELLKEAGYRELTRSSLQHALRH